MKKTVIIPACVLLLTGCGNSGSSAESDMIYIKTSVMYDTLYDMYQNPDQYMGKKFHMSGQLYPSKDDNGDTFYSVYTENSTGAGLGLELDWSDYSGLNDMDTITVEGTLDKETLNQGGSHTAQSEYLILRVTSLEKREEKG